MTTGLVWHERYMWHDTRHAAAAFPSGGWIEPDTHAENPLTKRRLKNLMDASGLTPQLRVVEPRMATVEEVCRFHERGYVDRIKALSDDNGGDAGGLTPFGPGSYEIALLAAGGVLAACDAVLDGAVRNVYALVRPPGHHALAGEGMGFCIFGNAAIAAHHLRSARGLARVAIVDWDVHHGNGTQSAFYDDPSVLTISLHQDGCFPLFSGAVEDNGEGAGAGANINIPLPRGGGRGAYVAALERVVVPALERFGPDFIIVANGLDAGAMDPLARMQMHSGGYRELTELIMGAADRGEKTIVFSGLRTMVAAIVRHLKAHGLGVLPITAEVPTKKRFGLIQDFSHDPAYAAIVASLNCLNRGFTITAANHVVIVDLEYSPEATEQAEDRVHRPGQAKPCYIHYLLSRDTIDQLMHEILTQKAQAIRHAIDGKARFEDVAEILKRVTGDVQLEIAKRIHLLPPVVPALDLHAIPEPLPPNVLPFAAAAVLDDAPRIEAVAPRILPSRVKGTQLSLFGSML